MLPPPTFPGYSVADLILSAASRLCTGEASLPNGKKGDEKFRMLRFFEKKYFLSLMLIIN
jgi:hypothetical protein